jgi:hypothetical protein
MNAGCAALPPTAWRNFTLTWAMCMTCSPKLRCAGVDL